MKIVIVGYYGFGNAGDELILKAIVMNLKKQYQNAEILVLSNNPLATRLEHGTESANRWSPFLLAKAIFGCKFLIFGGGGLLQDMTGTIGLWYYLFLLWLGIIFKKPILIYAVGVGPVRRGINKLLIAFTLSRVNRITVRDRESQIELEKMSVAGPIELTADPVLTLDLESSRMERETGSKEKIKIGFVIRPIRGQESLGKSLTAAAKEVRREMDGEIFLLPFQPSFDRRITQEVFKGLEGKAKVAHWKNLSELVRSFSRMDMIVSTRLHAIILAVLMKIPVVGIAADPKIYNFLRELCPNQISGGGRSMENCVSLEQCAGGELSSAILKCWKRRQEYLLASEKGIVSLRNRANLVVNA